AFAPGIIHSKPIIGRGHRFPVIGTVPSRGKPIKLRKELSVPIKDIYHGAAQGSSPEYLPIIVHPVPIGRKKFGIPYDRKRYEVGCTTSVLITDDHRVISGRHVVKDRAILKIAPIYGIFIITIGMLHDYFRDIVIGK